MIKVEVTTVCTISGHDKRCSEDEVWCSFFDGFANWCTLFQKRIVIDDNVDPLKCKECLEASKKAVK